MYLFDHLVQSLGNAEAGPSRQPEPELKPKQQVRTSFSEQGILFGATQYIFSSTK
jgi:hypothetical protein